MLPKLASIGLLVALGPTTTLATPPPQGVPTRIGNVYHGTAHEPDAKTTQTRERNSGIALPRAVQQGETGTVEQLDRQLEGNRR